LINITLQLLQRGINNCWKYFALVARGINNCWQGFAVAAKGVQQLLTGLYNSCKEGSTVVDRASHWLQRVFNSRWQGFAVVVTSILDQWWPFPTVVMKIGYLIPWQFGIMASGVQGYFIGRKKERNYGRYLNTLVPTQIIRKNLNSNYLNQPGWLCDETTTCWFM